MSHTIEGVELRGILDSRGGIAAEAVVRLAGGGSGTASTPLAIARGRREQRRSQGLRLGRLANGHAEAMSELGGVEFADQRHFDAALAMIEAEHALGSDLTAALSFAFARACAHGAATSLARHVGRLAGRALAMPHPLVNVFSGGVHLPERRLPFQQIMLVPAFDTIVEDVEAALRVYAAVERALDQAGTRYGYSASSGLITESLSYREQLGLAREAIERAGCTGRMELGIDVAAEHLLEPGGRYRLGAARLDGDALAGELLDLMTGYGVSYVEDPFDSERAELWRAFARAVPAGAVVVGDDLFASNARYVSPGLAHGILLKVSQVGTLSRALDAAAAALRNGMMLCVSHRSGETEDTAICDLAVGLGARHVKIGGPRRGDRIAKYNQLLRLADTLVTAA
jgi:enolase